MAARALRGADGKMFVEAVGQQAFQLVASGDTTSPAVTVALNAKSRAIVERLLTGDVSLLLKALDRGSDSAEVAKQESGLLANRRETFGDFKSIDVLGTVPGPESNARAVG